MNSSLMTQVGRIAADVFAIPLDQIGPHSSPDNVGNWDSIQHLNLVLALEQEFGIQFTPEEIEQLLSVELIADLVDEKQKACGVL